MAILSFRLAFVTTALEVPRASTRTHAEATFSNYGLENACPRTSLFSFLFILFYGVTLILPYLRSTLSAFQVSEVCDINKV